MFHPEQQIGGYTLVRRVGRGGFGEVWLAERRGKYVTTEVAIKLPIDDQVDPEAIKQEAEIWKRASGHPNVLPIIEADENNGQVFIVSEFVSDGSLDSLLEKSGGTLSLKHAVELTIGILGGLNFLHSRGIIHRDIKPANIMLQGNTPRLADFGVSRIIKQNYSSRSAGTPAYMAPEAFDGERYIETDIWSVGIILYEMIVGKTPFSKKGFAETMMAVVVNEPEPIPDAVPQPLKRVIYKALRKQRLERYQSANQMQQELQHLSLKIFHGESAGIKIPSGTHEQNYDATTKTDLHLDTTIHNTNTHPQVATSAELSKKPEQYSLYYKVLTSVAISVFLALGSYFFIDRQVLQTKSISNSTSDLKESPQTISTSSPKEEGIQLIPFRKYDKWGFNDKSGSVVIEPKYNAVGQFSDGLALVRVSDKWGFIDDKGQEVIPIKYNFAKPFSEGLAIVKADNKFGFVDKLGKIVIEPKYEAANSFSQGMAWVQLNKKWGFIDKEGNVIVPFK